jgi:pimeloyl-ACP methyl ester carboxylesterase
MPAVAIVLAALAAAVVVLAAYAAWAARRAEAQVPPLGRFVEVGAARVHYVDRGAGPAVVLLHGLGGNLRNFHALIERLAARHRVIAPDRPGCGYSTMPGAQPDLFAQAALVAAFLRRLGVSRPLVVGHSMGGALALALALDHPDSVRALVLIAPASHETHEAPPGFEGLAIASPWRRQAIAWTLAAPLGRLRRAAVLRAVFAPEPVPPDFDAAAGAVLGTRPRSFVAASAEMQALPDELAAMTPRYASLALPVDVVCGRDDPVCPPAVHGAPLAAAIPGARLHLIDGGHMIVLTRAEAVAALVARAARMPGVADAESPAAGA